MNRRIWLLAILAALAACTNAGDDDVAVLPAKPVSVDAVQVVQNEAAIEVKRLQNLWVYQSVAVTGGVQRSASIDSRTVPVEDGEIIPVPDAQLVLRDHPSWGRSAYLLLARSRFNCGKPCVMMIAFDAGEPHRFVGLQADSGKGPALFINDESGFINALKKAKVVRIALPKGSGLVSSLTFEVAGFDAASYARGARE